MLQYKNTKMCFLGHIFASYSWNIALGNVIGHTEDKKYSCDITEAFNSTSRYLDGVLNIDNTYFECMVNQRRYEYSLKSFS